MQYILKYHSLKTFLYDLFPKTTHTISPEISYIFNNAIIPLRYLYKYIYIDTHVYHVL